MLTRRIFIAKNKRHLSYKLKEWVDNKPHKFFRETQEWGLSLDSKGYIEGYAAEFQPLPELELSARDFTGMDINAKDLLGQVNLKKEKHAKRMS